MVQMSHILSAAEAELQAGHQQSAVMSVARANAAGRHPTQDDSDCDIHVSLDDRELWTKFQCLTNEMIVTKNGRRMFPVVKVSVSGLDATAMYSVLLEFVQVDAHRWKYVNGEWVPGGKAEVAPANPIYVHPESPNFGAHWMREPVSFAKVKLTNKTNGNGQIMLNSLHKYEPRVHVVRVGTESRRVVTYPFPETQFIAVTAYQNEEVTSLKIKYNPFAKAFLDAKERPDAASAAAAAAAGLFHHHQMAQRVEHAAALSHQQQQQYSPYGTWLLPQYSSTHHPGLVAPSMSPVGATHCSSSQDLGLRTHRHSPYSVPSHHQRSPRSQPTPPASYTPVECNPQEAETLMMIPPAVPAPSSHTVSWPSGSPISHSATTSPPPSAPAESTSATSGVVSWANLSPIPCTTSPPTSGLYYNGMSPSVVWPTPSSPGDLHQSPSRVSPQAYHSHHHHFMQPMMDFTTPPHHHLYHHHGVMAPPPLIAMPDYQPSSPNIAQSTRPHHESPPPPQPSHHSFETLAKSEVLSEPYSEDESNSRNDWSPLTPPTGL
ncbi:hypothetical protein B566_EDAN004749 [Ephemera danica]|nr:hypothetical protein B566_EDAN004749 [Ephemera danica]